MNEKQLLLDSLRESRTAFVSALDGVTEAEAIGKPGPDQWSVLECAEHVVIAEALMFRLVSHGSPSTEPAPGDRGREERIRAAAVDRSRKFVAPQLALPRGRFASVSEAAEQFLASRACTVRFVESCSDDLRSLSTVHPAFGRITCQECLLYLIAHPARHAQQIREIRRQIAVK
jgi:DinB superfamily